MSAVTVVDVDDSQNGSGRAKLIDLGRRFGLPEPIVLDFVNGLDQEGMAEALFQASRGDAGRVALLDDARASHRKVRVTRASDISVRPVRWEWKDRAPAGTLGLLGGREGIGKGILAYSLTADMTRGRLPGASFGVPRNVVVTATEDSWGHIIVPRLMAAGADLNRVIRLDVETAAGFDAELSLPLDLPALEEVLLQTKAGGLVLDPLMSRLDSQLDTHKDAEVRRALEPLVRVIEATNVVALGLIHVNKTTSSDPLTLLMGSRAFAAVARFVLFVMVDPEDEGIRLVGQPKNNYGRTDLPTLKFSIANSHVADTEEGAVWTGRLEWLGESDRDVRQVLASVDGDGNLSQVGECADWLQEYLESNRDAAPSKQVKQAAKEAGYTGSTLQRARQRLHLRITSEGFPRQTWWNLASRVSPGESGMTEMTETTGGSPPSRVSHSSGARPHASVEPLAPPTEAKST